MRRERAPIWIAILAAIGAAFFVVPLIGLVVKTPWGDALQSLTSTDTMEALKLSLIASLSATAVSLVLGVPLAWIYARIDFPGRTVLRPLIAPSLLAGAVLCWARALGEFGATITFAGNFPGVTQTMPLAVYLLLESNHPEGSFILSLLLLLVSLAVLVGLRHRWLGSA